MALVKCPDCGKMVSERVSECPECGCLAKYFIQINTESQENATSNHNNSVESQKIQEQPRGDKINTQNFSQVAGIRCRNCGKVFNEGIFCPECGTKNDVNENTNTTKGILNNLKSINTNELASNIKTKITHSKIIAIVVIIVVIVIAFSVIGAISTAVGKALIEHVVVIYFIAFYILGLAAYHSIFDVWYFDLKQGLTKELVYGFIFSVIMTALATKYWLVSSIILLLVGAGIVAKQNDPTAKIAIAIIFVVAIFINVSVGIQANKIEKEKNETGKAIYIVEALLAEEPYNAEICNIIEKEMLKDI